MEGIFNQKLSWPLLTALFGTIIGALSGQFAWALITALGLWALAYIAQNLSAPKTHLRSEPYTDGGNRLRDAAIV